MDVGEYLEFDFAPSNVLNMIIMRPETLRDTFQELDLACEFVELYINPDFGFMISAACSGVSVQVGNYCFSRYQNCQIIICG
ncbi:unnamed protein product [Soboliphyme baturini]|uniref:AraC family transcriptional regulator n=1 Tax=Soboliphyme baturini TaxID=241478 RepID=A0A183J6I9_9BILA|nr:unnamed protein product [Soboliphyme baturini]